MAKANNEGTVWHEINPETLDDGLLRAYQSYKAAYARMKAERVQFEDSMQLAAALPVGKRMVFGYNFGKLSVAIVDDDRKPKTAQPAKQSLSDFLAAQARR